jgi:TDG/mug DNA glycosylase family protein
VRAGLDVLFVGINPGLYSAWAGQHFARPGNRFWPALHLAGLTPRRLHPSEQWELLELGLGITNIVARATASAGELRADELREGVRRLDELVREVAPATLAFLGITAYRTAFEQPKAKLGEQPVRLGSAGVWVLPNPSGLNAHFSLDALAECFAQLRESLGPGE